MLMGDKVLLGLDSEAVMLMQNCNLPEVLVEVSIIAMFTRQPYSHCHLMRKSIATHIRSISDKAVSSANRASHRLRTSSKGNSLPNNSLIHLLHTRQRHISVLDQL